MINQNLLLTGDDGYNLTNSLRFRSSASAYLNRTPASATNQRTFTWSGWVKLGTLGTDRGIFGASQGSGYGTTQKVSSLAFTSTDTLRWVEYYSADGISTTWSYSVVTTPVYRDPSAWYHIVVAVDTTQATAANRIKLYVNGLQVTALGTENYPTQNFDSWVNTTSTAHQHGFYSTGTPYYFDGYLAEVNFIDGQALTPSSFGETSTSTGVWIPKKYTGTYGTNGFYLPFTDTTSTSTLGTDFSGNSNTWTVNNISLTSGSTYDSMNDVPTLTSATTANYWTLNPLNTGQLGTVQSGNLEWIGGDQNNFRTVAAQILPTTGKFYWEVTPIGGGSGGAFVSGIYIGIMNYANGGTGLFASGARIADTGKDDYVYYSDGRKVNLNSFVSYGNSYAANDVIGIAVDIDNGKIWYSKNGTWQASGDPAAGTNAAYTTVPFSTKTYAPAMSAAEITNPQKYNFGQRPFSYTPPAGFKTLCTTNLSTPTIGATASTTANKYFNPVIWTGTGGTRSITGVGFQPDFVWAKARSQAYSNIVFDSNRGVGKSLLTDTTGAEATNEANGYISSFDADGFSSNFSAAANYYFNQSGTTYVAWCWKANGAGSTNTAGSITSTVSANTTAGFSIVTYTGNATNDATIGHGLGVAPSMVITKNRGTSTFWYVYHSSLPATYNLYLNNTDSQQPDNVIRSTSATTFTVSSSSAANGTSMVAYCWTPIAGYSAFGSYTGNGSTDGTFVYTGFRPRFVMIKCSSSDQGGNAVWVMLDTARNTYNVTNNRLKADSSTAEDTSPWLDINSNGFKIRETSTSVNGSSATYIYMAFAESPFKYANAR